MRTIASRFYRILSTFCLFGIVFSACQQQESVPVLEEVAHEPQTVPLAYQGTGEDDQDSGNIFNCLPMTRGRAVIPEAPSSTEDLLTALDALDPSQEVLSGKSLPIEPPFETPISTQEFQPAVTQPVPTVVVFAPDYADPAKLTRWSETTGLGGKQMYDLYNRMWADHDGWWWVAFGDGGYTIWDFVSTFSYYEASGNTHWADVMAEAGVRWYYATGVSYGVPGSVEGMLNWWGAFSQSTAEVYLAGIGYELSLPWTFSWEDLKKMQVIGDSFDNPPEAWMMGYAAERPFGWGNLYVCYSDKDILDERRMVLLSNPDSLFIYFGKGDSAFVVPSGCAWATGYNLWYGHECATVTDYTFAR